MSKRIASLAFIILVILTLTGVAILVAKGYRFDRHTGTIKGTGIISVASIPSGAAIYLDGELQTASNNTINDLDPKTYHLKVTKDGYSNWEKDVAVTAEKVSLVTVTLFPVAPDLRPLTFSGVVNPQLSPDGQRIVYAVTDPAKAGLWMLDLSNRPFTFSRDPKQIVKDSSTTAFSKSEFSWAPDSNTVLSTVSGKSFLVDVNASNDNPVDVATTIIQTRATWQSDADLKNKDRLTRIPDGLKQSLNPSAKWSPDELKVAWTDQDGIKVYDSKTKLTSKIGSAKNFSWYPDSLHLVLANDGQISIVEIDGTNKTTAYEGGYDGNLVFPWPDGSQLVILASFNKSTGLNLYSIGLR